MSTPHPGPCERGDQVVLLSPAEVETLMRFAGRMLRVED